ncbi:hypothetical protein [Ensifer sesbaniae]|uniref:hypothetical protein n=1 Tax=Ensifer sesbaniae TaxID=1214071 RepID=UPI00156A3A1E|nr:hypothetical protein [Ensifer sesbaniae]NRQ15186.1 hypothetical protein [Ensifer sesbaniae]
MQSMRLAPSALAPSAFALSALALSLLPLATVHAEPPTYALHYALMLDGEDPVAGEVACVVGEPCEFTPSPESKMTFKLSRRRNEIEITCPERDCSLGYGERRTYCGPCEEVDIFEGRDYGGVAIELVLRSYPRLGTLLLRYQTQ